MKNVGLVDSPEEIACFSGKSVPPKIVAVSVPRRTRTSRQSVS
ncbi:MULTISPECIES: hypothetical protein [unclassified Streptomyces]|nr:MULTISPECIES: hypothetical protein [unclassified Streptomyces]